jgi:hypothetical protein
VKPIDTFDIYGEAVDSRWIHQLSIYKNVHKIVGNSSMQGTLTEGEGLEQLTSLYKLV